MLCWVLGVGLEVVVRTCSAMQPGLLADRIRTRLGSARNPAPPGWCSDSEASPCLQLQGSMRHLGYCRSCKQKSLEASLSARRRGASFLPVGQPPARRDSGHDPTGDGPETQKPRMSDWSSPLEHRQFDDKAHRMMSALPAKVGHAPSIYHAQTCIITPHSQHRY